MVKRNPKFYYNHLSLTDRFYAFTLIPYEENGCIEWIGYINRGGYGAFKHKGNFHLAHRLSYILHNGKIPKDMHVCHRCDNPKCVRPDHLWLGTAKDNINDMVKKKRRNYQTENRSCKLKKHDVVEIRKLLKNKEKAIHIAKKFGVGANTISRIKLNISWRDI